LFIQEKFNRKKMNCFLSEYWCCSLKGISTSLLKAL
jgi:hypothetical protein